jgi:hypothetical protein
MGEAGGDEGYLCHRHELPRLYPRNVREYVHSFWPPHRGSVDLAMGISHRCHDLRDPRAYVNPLGS